LSYIILLAAAAFFMYALIHKPEIVAVLLFTIVLTQLNITFLRPVLTLALFGRIIVDKKTRAKYPAFLTLPYVKLLTVFLIYGLFISLWQELYNYDLLKGDIDTVMLSYCVYHFYFKHENADQLQNALIITGLICFADLAYTYIVFGSFPIHRLFNLITGIPEDVGEEEISSGANWNFYGQMCGMCFVFILSDFVKFRSLNKFKVWLLPIMLLGVFMSTSRSAILALLIITILIIINGINYKEQKRRLAKVGVFAIGAAMIGFLLLALLGKYINLNTKVLDEISSRLTEEPVAMLQKAMGQSYNVNSLGSMDWREESAENAYAAYLNLPLTEQIFGIGIRGFESRKLGHGFNAHNATLLLLIEYGMVGFALFFLLIGGIIIQSFSQKNASPSLMVIIFIIIYGLGQNREWTSWTMFLFVFCVVAELQLIRVKKQFRSIELSSRKTALHPIGKP
jgi:hypothetical protein